MDWKLLRKLYVTENHSLLSEYTDLTLRTVVKQVELFVLVFLRVEKDLQSVGYRITKSRVQFILIASVFFVEVFMDADMPNLAKGLACSTRRIVIITMRLVLQARPYFIKVLKKRQSANYTIWSVVFVILYQTH